MRTRAAVAGALLLSGCGLSDLSLPGPVGPVVSESGGVEAAVAVRDRSGMAGGVSWQAGVPGGDRERLRVGPVVGRGPVSEICALVGKAMGLGFIVQAAVGAGPAPAAGDGAAVPAAGEAEAVVALDWRGGDEDGFQRAAAAAGLIVEREGSTVTCRGVAEGLVVVEREWSGGVGDLEALVEALEVAALVRAGSRIIAVLDGGGVKQFDDVLAALGRGTGVGPVGVMVMPAGWSGERLEGWLVEAGLSGRVRNVDGVLVGEPGALGAVERLSRALGAAECRQTDWRVRSLGVEALREALELVLGEALCGQFLYIRERGVLVVSHYRDAAARVLAALERYDVADVPVVVEGVLVSGSLTRDAALGLRLGKRPDGSALWSWALGGGIVGNLAARWGQSSVEARRRFVLSGFAGEEMSLRLGGTTRLASGEIVVEGGAVREETESVDLGLTVGLTAEMRDGAWRLSGGVSDQALGVEGVVSTVSWTGVVPVGRDGIAVVEAEVEDSGGSRELVAGEDRSARRLVLLVFRVRSAWRVVSG